MFRSMLKTIIAHRGASYLAPEETRPAYLLARELGADYLELDVQRSKDGVLIAFHDGDLSRTTNVAQVFPGRANEPIGQFTYSELQSLDAGSWFNSRFPSRARASFSNLKILKLEEVEAIAQAGSRLYLETKSAHLYPGIEKQIVELLKASAGWISDQAGADRLIFQSFEPESLAKLEVLAPRVPKVLLADDLMIREWGWLGLLEKHKELAAGIGPSVDWLAQPWRIFQAHKAGLLVHAWTIDRAWEMRLLDWCGADGIFTNRCELALKLFGRLENFDLEQSWNKIQY